MLNLIKPRSAPSTFSRLLLDNQAKNKKILVLDLDETLIHCRMVWFENVTATTKICAKNREVTLYVCERPGLKEFLKKMSRLYTLVLFTSAVEDYALAILKLMGIEHFFANVLHRNHCKSSGNTLKKDLSILGVHYRDFILVDDSLAHITYQPNNILLIHPFKGDPNDRELDFIAEFLEILAKEEDVRPVMDRFIKFKVTSEETSPVLSMRAETIKKYLSVMFVQSMKSLESKKAEEGYDSTVIEDENFDEVDCGTEISKLFSQEKKLMDSLKLSATSTEEKPVEVEVDFNSEESTSPGDDSPPKQANSTFLARQRGVGLKFFPTDFTHDKEEIVKEGPLLDISENDPTPRTTSDKLPTISSQLLEARKRID